MTLLQSKLIRSLGDLRRLQSFLDALRIETDSEGALFRVVSLRDFTYPLTLTSGALFSQAFFQAYDAGMVTMDPQLRVAFDHRLGPGEVYLCSDHYDDAARAAEPYFNEFLPRYDIRWFGGYLAQIGGEYGVGFGVGRSSNRSPFGDAEKMLMAPLARVLEGCGESMIRHQQLKLVNAAMDEALRARPDFAACIDGQAHVLWTDDPGEKILNSLKRLRIQNGVLTAFGGRYAEGFIDRVKRIAAEGARSGVIKKDAMSVAIESGQRMNVRMQTIFAEDDEMEAKGISGALILGERRIVAADAGAPSPGDISALSPMELRVAAQVAEGLTTPEIAGRMGVAQSTVQTHLKRSYKKLGLKNRQALAALFVEASVAKDR